MASEDIPQVGDRLQGRYEILAELGVGSFGRVYRALQLTTGREVAVKTLVVDELDTHADIELRTARFRREMKLCATLSHPHVVRLIDSGELEGGRLFAVFDLVPGRTLREVLATEGPLGVPESVGLMTQVLDALSCAHGHEVVHRDLKPANIMVTSTGVRRNALVLDFGLGVSSAGEYAGDRSRLTVKGEMMGTPCYAAPEQLRGEPPSPRSDLYSWGLVFLECLTGEVAVSGSNGFEVLQKQLAPEPIPIPPWLRDRRLRRVLEAVTEKDVRKRDVTIPALLESLGLVERQLSGAPAGALRRSAFGEGVRRQVTVVSCRVTLERSDGTAAELEELDHVLRAQDELYTRVAAQQGGIVTSRAGERTQLVFGSSRMQEDDARRSVRAALSLVAQTREASAVLEVEHGLRIDLRVGVHSGVVLVRDDASGLAACDIIGSCPRMAEWFDEHARRAEVLVSVDTWRLLRGAFECESAGEITLPAGAVRAFRVTEPRLLATLATVAASDEMPLVGRAMELDHLLQLWQRVEQGHAEALLLSGEPGIGKSRLMRELRQRVPATAYLQGRCSAENQGSPLRPIVDLLLSIPEPIEALLGRYGFQLTQEMPLFASLLGLPEGARFPPLRFSPERQKELTLTAVVTLLMRMAQRSPLMIVLEDLHWADPTTRELLVLLIQELRAARFGVAGTASSMGLVMTARADFSPPWALGEVGLFVLERLDRDAVETMVRNELGEAAVSLALLDHIVARADGVPLFVEELTRVVAESGVLAGNGRAETELPATLRQLLVARIDRLSPSARDTLQLAAVLGREFRQGLLRVIALKDEWTLREDLRELCDARLLYGRQSTAAASFVFKHSLVRDAAYDSMMRAARQDVHARVAEALREHAAEVPDQQPELLAQHLEAAGQTAASVEYWQRAGDRALRRATYTEAAQHLQRGLKATAHLRESDERARLEVELLTSYGTVLFSTQGFAAPEVETTFARAQALCERLGQEVHPKILSGIVGVHINRGDREATDRLLPQFEGLTERTDDVVAMVTGFTTLGMDAFWRGQHVRARTYLENARRAYITESFQHYVREYGYDGGIFSCAYIAWNLWALGQPVQAEAAYAELVTMAERSLDPFSRPLALAFGVALAYSRRDPDETEARAVRLIEVATEEKFYFWLTIGMFGRGGAATLRGRPGEAVPDIQQGLAVARTLGATTVYGHYLTFLAAAHCAAGGVDEGLVVVDEGLDLCARALACYQEPELYRLRGEMLRQRGDHEAAETALRTAVALARDRDARGWELRAATSLASLLFERGRGLEGQQDLARVYASFTEGLNLPDLEDARTMLERLA